MARYLASVDDANGPCYGIEIDENGMIVKSAPIGRWTLGKNIRTVTEAIRRRGGNVQVRVGGRWRDVKEGNRKGVT